MLIRVEFVMVNMLMNGKILLKGRFGVFVCIICVRVELLLGLDSCFIGISVMVQIVISIQIMLVMFSLVSMMWGKMWMGFLIFLVMLIEFLNLIMVKKVKVVVVVSDRKVFFFLDDWKIIIFEKFVWF